MSSVSRLWLWVFGVALVLAGATARGSAQTQEATSRTAANELATGQVDLDGDQSKEDTEREDRETKVTREKKFHGKLQKISEQMVESPKSRQPQSDANERPTQEQRENARAKILTVKQRTEGVSADSLEPEASRKKTPQPEQLESFCWKLVRVNQVGAQAEIVKVRYDRKANACVIVDATGRERRIQLATANK